MRAHKNKEVDTKVFTDFIFTKRKGFERRRPRSRQAMLGVAESGSRVGEAKPVTEP